jgi:Kef-type K+ transport system membrane component KefB
MSLSAPIALASISVKTPTGPVWQFLILFLVVIVGPPLVQRARIPGIIALIIGGYAIGPFGLNVIGAGNTTVPELGQLGLLYLMFIAGVELDLALVRVHRRAVLTFGLITFAVPMAVGSAIGFSMSWGVPAAILLGALVSSHTLLLYPTVRQAGLSTDLGVATAVGATVLTDTLALVVLASVSGSQLAGGSASSIGLQIVLGLAVLVVFALAVLPWLVRLGFRLLGVDRVVRYLLAITAFLAAGTVARSFGIEPIVGAFFAGLGLNRLVPNEGPLMERLDFFGSAVFVPIFLVSVGMLLDPKVMFHAETLKLAGLFILAAIGGKTIAAWLSRPVIGLSRPQVALMLGLTIPQAAATLAATVVGFNIGLFSESVVNAILVLILVSIVIGTVIVERSKSRVPAPIRSAARQLGERVVVALEDPDQARLGFAIGARLVTPDSGVVRGVLACSREEVQSRAELLDELSAAAFMAGIDAEPRLMVHTGLAEGILNIAVAEQASFVLIGQPPPNPFSALGTTAEAVAAASPIPVAILMGNAAEITDVHLIEPDGSNLDVAGADTLRVANEFAVRLGGSKLRTLRTGDGGWRLEPRDGQLYVVPGRAWPLLASADPSPGTAIVVVLESGAPWPVQAIEGAATAG